MYHQIARHTGMIKRESKDLAERKNICGNQIMSWKNYIDQRYSVLPEELQFTNKMRQNLMTIYQVFRERKVGLLESKFMLEFLNEYAKLYKFEVPIDHEILVKQIHPKMGYLTKLDKFIEFEFIEQFFKVMLVASFEKLQGQTLLSSEVCSYGYWMHADKREVGYLNIEDFSQLMKTFSYQVNDWNHFESEFPLAFKYFSDYIQRDADGKITDKNIVPFDIFRYIYLERNL